jgi:hypothetical protein
METSYVTLDMSGIDITFKATYIYYPEETSYPDAPDLPEDIEVCGLYIVSDHGHILPVDNLLQDSVLATVIADSILDEIHEQQADSLLESLL